MSAIDLTLPANDGLLVGATWSPVKRARAVLLLCHRSHFHRGEYAEITPKLTALGYACLAIDQRSGMKVLGRENETYLRAKQRGLPTGYGNARPDIEGAISFCRRKKLPVLLVGSSYSASLAWLVAGTRVHAMALFSPGQYLKGIDITQTPIEVPTFVTAARKEVAGVKRLLPRTPNVTLFSPRAEGAHGARCLWERSPGHAAYWAAFTHFLGLL
jgi:alpha-beta hydrolase superfamily lysophospholipase